MNDALARHQKMVEQYPDNELARFSLGKALFDEGQHAAALEHLLRALAGQPDWMAVQILVARCELMLGDKAAARVSLEKARQLAIRQGHVGPLAQVEELLKQVQ